VSISVLPEDRQELTMHGLRAAAKHIRRDVADRIRIREMPAMEFRLDESIKKQGEVLAAINRAVTLPDEAARLVGGKDPLAEERFARLRSALNEVFRRENALTLAHLREENKRDAKAYLESIPGLPAYAANRVALVGCGVHTFPIDPVLRSLFDAAGVIEAGTDEAHLAARCERTLRAGEALGRFLAAEAAALTPPKRPATKKTTRKAGAAKKKTAAKKTAKKTTKKRGKKTA
jgi:hypothetical protein